MHSDDMIVGKISEGHLLLVIGLTCGHLGQSALLAEVYGRAEGDSPNVDLEAEKRNGEFISDNHSMIRACTDLSDGGLALAAFELAEEAQIGITIDYDDTPNLFGEDQARYLIACSFDQAEDLMITAAIANVPITMVGKVGGDQITFGNYSHDLADLTITFRTSFEAAVA